MALKKLPSSLAVIFLILFAFPAQAELSAFISGSYQHIVAANAKQPFMLVVWSVNCPSCLKEMALLSDIHKSRPELKIIMLAADEPSETEQIKQILQKKQLLGLENWAYADENTQKLQFEIDPAWYGELPRTYFFNNTHQRTGVSGTLSAADYEEVLTKILE
ncbi:MAG: hypothetical protein Q8S52_03440 [Methylobacter sp.]|nr:hypothetical protein [Methylobacter sp.]MDP2429497.1 hypothetical protein [Methylobacter sp.]MDP3055808.1 hypothetical protein [Methylobacter sp.]MDP3361159.1 hypothetical protein [Methylobacter sp.]